MGQAAVTSMDCLLFVVSLSLFCLALVSVLNRAMPWQSWWREAVDAFPVRDPGRCIRLPGPIAVWHRSKKHFVCYLKAYRADAGLLLKEQVSLLPRKLLLPWGAWEEPTPVRLGLRKRFWPDRPLRPLALCPQGLQVALVFDASVVRMLQRDYAAARHERRQWERRRALLWVHFILMGFALAFTLWQSSTPKRGALIALGCAGSLVLVLPILWLHFWCRQDWWERVSAPSLFTGWFVLAAWVSAASFGLGAGPPGEVAVGFGMFGFPFALMAVRTWYGRLKWRDQAKVDITSLASGNFPSQAASGE